MKKICNYFKIYLFLFILFSCADSSEDGKIRDEKLFTNLTEYNESLIYSSLSTQSRCSGFWDCLGHVTAVAGADIIGAAAGVAAVKEIAAVAGATTGGVGAGVVAGTAAAIAGAGASYVTHKELKNMQPPPPPTPTAARFGPYTFTTPLNMTFLDSVGTDHNVVIHNNFFRNEDFSTFYDRKRLNQREIDIMESFALRSSYDIIYDGAKMYAIDFNHRAYTSRLLTEKLFSNDLKVVLDLFLDGYNLCETDEDIESIVKYYTSQVANSNLTTNEKESLFAAFHVACHSPYYFLN